MSGERVHYSLLQCRCVPCAEPPPRSVIRTIPVCIEMGREREFRHPLADTGFHGAITEPILPWLHSAPEICGWLAPAAP